MLRYELNKAIADLKVAVVTPTYERDRLLRQSYRYFKAQENPFHALRWFVLDDSRSRSGHDFFSRDADVDYQWTSERLPLGEKRNRLNDAAMNWGADIVCSMDDDDWYGPDYTLDMSALLLQSDACFAGSGDDYYFDVDRQRVLFVPAVRESTSCNGVLCYKSYVLQSRRYDCTKKSGEEPSFIQRDKILQHSDIKRVHLAMAYNGNTVSKRGYTMDKRRWTQLTLDDFPMHEQHRTFYRQSFYTE